MWVSGELEARVTLPLTVHPLIPMSRDTAASSTSRKMLHELAGRASVFVVVLSDPGEQ
jgi:hypothetical protein